MEEYQLASSDKFQVLRDVALEQAQLYEERTKCLTRSLVICGSKQVGKTTMLNSLLDRNAPVRPTLALEYSFGRKMNRDGVKDTCNLWELGGGTSFCAVIPQLITAPLKEARLASLAIVLDLTKPSQLWLTLDKLMGTVKQCLKEYGEHSSHAYDAYYNKRLHEILANHPNHPDKGIIEPTIVRSYIIGGKYDEFKNVDPDKKKVICRALRVAALLNGSSLHFISTTETPLMKRGREVLLHAGFDFNLPNSVIVDHNSPLSIPPGHDTLDGIGIVSGKNYRAVKVALDAYYTSHFPQTEEEKLEPEDPCAQLSFKEPELDLILKRKRREIV